ncbi:MAG: hypothetical protein RMJ35_04015 [Phycisphaerales bacterium]|nr:hypothetical protein [Phycisphaerales bacterium]
MAKGWLILILAMCLVMALGGGWIVCPGDRANSPAGCGTNLGCCGSGASEAPSEPCCSDPEETSEDARPCQPSIACALECAACAMVGSGSVPPIASERTSHREVRPAFSGLIHPSPAGGLILHGLDRIDSRRIDPAACTLLTLRCALNL